MPAVNTGSKVLLTGGTGFLGAWVLKNLLEEGFSVRAAVRSEAKASVLKEQFSQYINRLEFVYIDDLTTPGIFDKAVADVEGIIHCASPLGGSDPDLDPQRLIGPAVDGTLSILRSAINSTNVKRVVVTSSVTTAWQAVPKYTPIVYNENDWNEQAVELVKAKGKEAPPFIKYAASKVLAEQAAWNFMKENNPNFDLVTILPGYVWGKILGGTAADIKGSNARLLNLLKSSTLANRTPEAMKAEWPIVDARDVSSHHVQALTAENAGGERLLSVAATISTQDAINLINANPIEGIVLPQSETLGDWIPNAEIANEKIQKVLEVTFRPVADTVRETVVGAIEAGWKQ
ncbi:hypothetical protein M408DRAFT_239176 [Serendipita vermifera MAFF 305830]|uniref:NAD-dependent epimerase/dehydratase domain-containing protein n=1 Tax=Serendipita vermifera MAFF 305830 TaxID=933852 RepID=A0A0C2X0L9_SERVB|nr:hypothetical protein M408DRAFT_239176 [Serendipita vermifera MAFF 305830]